MKNAARIMAISVAVLALGYEFIAIASLLVLGQGTIFGVALSWGLLIAFAIMTITFGIVIPAAVYYLVRGIGWALEKLMR